MNNTLHPKALESNRKGKLTLMQAIGQLRWVLFGAFLFLSGAGMVYGFIYNLMTKSFGVLETIVMAIMLLGGGGAFMWFGYLLGGRLLIDLLLGQVRQVSGLGMKFSGASSSKGVNYYYSVDRQNFQVPSRGTYQALHDADFDIAYYLPRSKTLINLETSDNQTWSQGRHGVSSRRVSPDESMDRLQRLEEAEREASEHN